MDRDGWKGEIVQTVKGFEERRIENAEVKHAARHMEEVTPLPGKGSKEDLTCNICGHICLSKAGMDNHKIIPKST